MKTNMLAIGLCIANLIFASNALSEEFTLYFMRHAEKQNDGTKNPALTKAGVQRADALKALLGRKPIQNIYSTQYLRTLQTAGPLAETLGLAIEHYDPRALQNFANKLISDAETVFVAGHSNTTPLLVELVGGKAKELKETDYGDLFIVSVTDSGVRTEIKRVGR